jgi:hypothetical protein
LRDKDRSMNGFIKRHPEAGAFAFGALPLK